MTLLQSRIDGCALESASPVICDLGHVDGVRVGDDLATDANREVVGRWPDALDTDAAVRLAETVGDPISLEALIATPPVAQGLAERARPQPLDLAIRKHLRHLQHVCHKPRLHLRVEEERLPVSRARRIPVRAVADLVSHPGDWEHRTIRSIQPTRVLARQTEDEWNLYENRVAARLADHLLAYLAKRLEELRRINAVVEERRNYSEQLQSTSHWRANRIAKLWSIDSDAENELRRTMTRLEHAQSDLQTLLDTPLYRNVPRRHSVAHALKPTNILLNDAHYRKVAILWRAWVQHGHRKALTSEQRATKRAREAACWDQFVLHLVLRSFRSLGWTIEGDSSTAFELEKTGWSRVALRVDQRGCLSVSADQELAILPVCANLSAAESDVLSQQVEALDKHAGEVVLAHVDPDKETSPKLPVEDIDRATGWSIEGRSALFACSPWSIDSEERMTRLIQGWLCRAASPDYPAVLNLRELPRVPQDWAWAQQGAEHLLALRAPADYELSSARKWAAASLKHLEQQAQRAKAAKQAFPVAPLEAVRQLNSFLSRVPDELEGLDDCPVCGGKGRIEPRPGSREDGADATWWATCTSCFSEWGTRRCSACKQSYRALDAATGLDLELVASCTEPRDWPDEVLGRDVWAQPCWKKPGSVHRCPQCGACEGGRCDRCDT